MKVGLIVPVCNEGNRVSAVIDAALDSGHVDGVIVVNDGSTDDTSDVLALRGDITVLTHPHNFGKGEVLTTDMRRIKAKG